MNHEEKENSATDLNIGTGSESMAASVINTPSATPGGAVEVRKSGDADPAKTGTAKKIQER